MTKDWEYKKDVRLKNTEHTGNIDALRNGNDNHNFLKARDQQGVEPQECSQAPSSLTDLLLWLQFLPYCSNYSEVITKVKEKLNGNNENFVTHLKESISELPMLFLQIEGKGERNQTSNAQGSSLFLKISELSKCQYIFHEKYYKDPQTVAKMLLCVFLVIHWGLNALKDRCKEAKCDKTIDKCDKTKKLLESLGWNGSKESTDTNELKPIITDKTKCQSLKDYLTNYLLGTSSGIAGMKRILEEVWKDTNGAAAGAVSSGASGSHLPRTIYEMLIWLMGLPVSGVFTQLKEKIQQQNNGKLEEKMQSFTGILFEVPNLFLALNGDLSGMLSSMFQCHNIDGKGPAYQYGSSGSDCLKIFSAIVAILYPVIRYLQQRCNGNGQTFVNDESWSTKQINADGLKTYLNFAGFEPLSDTFKQEGQQFHSTVLQPIFGDLTGQNGGANAQLYKLYDVAKAQLSKDSASGGQHAPTTIRQMMLWLIGLPVTTQYGDSSNGLMSEVTKKAQQITDLQNKINATDGHESFQHQLQHSIVGMMTAISQIEGGLGSVVEFLKDGFKVDNTHHLQYQSGEQLFTQFTTYVNKVHTQLRFLMTMCSVGKRECGWQDCVYTSKRYATTPGIKCACAHGSPVSCASEPLRHFLNSTSNKNQYKQGSELVEMGFTGTVNSPNIGYTGKDIYTYLKDLIDPINTQSNTVEFKKPLSLLTQYCVAIGQRQPQSLGDLFAFFAHLGQSWDNLKLYGNKGEKFSEKLEAELDKYKIGKYGIYVPCEQLKETIIALFSTHDSHDNKKDLMSLMCTTNTNGGTCAPYMKSLRSGLYSFYLPSITGSSGSFPFLQYLYDMLRKLLDKMKELKGAFDNCECCKKGSSSSCPNLIQCQYAHPILYKFGFVFGDPSKLGSSSGTSKKCTDIKAQLDKVLSCTKGSESALFSAFECVIQVTYSILLERAKGKVNGIYNTKNGDSTTEGLKSTNQEMNTAFTLYVHNAMYNSYPTLICTFACKVFDSGHKCETNKCSDFIQRIAEPSPKITASPSPITVTSSAVTSISPIIPQYTAPVIDRYHYRAFQKKGDTQAGGSPAPGQKSDGSTHYSFRDALDFHIKGAQCISPAPVALRSVIDWILRVTTGASATKGDKENGKNNDNIKGLSDAIKSVFTTAGVTASDVNNDNIQSHLNSLVTGLRKFVGYEDRSGEVKEGVKKALGGGNNGVKGALKGKIDKITDFIGEKGSKSFGSELGKALLKGRYAGTFKQKRDGLADTIISTLAFVTETITGIQEPLEQKTFKDVVGLFTKILSSTHEGCKELKCKSINSSASAPKSSEQKTGLEILKEFFQAVAKFNQWTYEIGDGHNNKSSSDIILRTRQGAEKTVSGTAMNGTNGNNGNEKYKLYYKLVTALATLGGCTHLVEKLLKPNGDDSSKYRNKIQALVSKLNEVLEALKINNGEKKDIPLDKVESANQALITRTKANVENRIKREIQEGVEEKYTEQNGNCTVQPAGTHTQHNGQKDFICIQSLITLIEGVINSKCDEFKSHLDDLKQLCQWLYRMAQLYANGLKGFVESLIEHLKHIVQVICWIEGIEKMMTKLKDISDKDKLCETINDLNGLSPCCNTSGHNNLYNSNKFSNRDAFFTALNCRINNLLGSYVLGLLPEGSDEQQNDTQKVQERRTLLLDLRLLALDRYTLQVWQDECNDKECNIKNWITFEKGIVRHSDLDAIKEKLHDLTGIAYSSNTASSSAPPSPSRSRIHDFHAICVLQKFSYEAPIAGLERSLKELEKIKDKLSGVKQKCNNGTQDLSSDPTVKEFCKLVDKFLNDTYGIFQFAKFVHTIMGPNIFSAVIAALEELTTEKLSGLKGNGEKKAKFCGIVNVMTEGLEGENGQKQNHYKLGTIITKLQEFISTLNKEYIFSYPVVTATATQAIVPAPPSPSAKIPKCENDDHSMSSICHHCYYYLARIFIGAIPNLYRHCRLLYEMCKYEGIGKDGLWYNDVLHYYNSGLHYHDPCYQALGVYMSWRGWKVYKKGSDEATEKYDLSTTHKGIKMFQSLEAIVSIKDPFKDSDLKPLDQLFKAVMEHFKKEREKLRKKREQELKRAFEDKNKDSGLQFVAPPPVLPSTVRQVLFWLHEMDTNKEFYDGMSEHINTLCRQSSIPISHDTILHVLKLSASQCLEVLATIEDPGRHNPQYYYELYTEEHYYAYPTVNIPLFFYTFVEKLMGAFLELNFVCVQCEFRALEGGWKDCHIGNEQASQGDYSKKEALCKCGSQSPPNSASPANCPRPLYSFLFDNKTDLKIPTEKKAYMSKGTMPCGFKLKNKAITDAATRGDAHNAPTPTPTSVSGSVLLDPLRKLVGGHVTGRLGSTTTNGPNTLSTVIYLRDLLRYTLCLAVRPPWSMSENMAFFYRVTESWKQKGHVALRNSKLLGAIHAEIALFPGTFKAELLTTAVERFAGIEDRNKHQKNSTASNGHHHFDLRTLMGCQEMNTTGSGTTPALCSTFMFPLSLDVYTHYDHRNSRAYLSWILNFAFGIYGQLKALEEMIKGSACVRNASQSNSQCPSLPTCPGVLTALYQSGSSFMDQGQLAKKENGTSGTNTTKKTCRDFHSVLGALFNCNTASCSPLHNLIVQCEAFLWSVRLPFSLVQLSLWSVAILFISYVFVVPLDHFKIKSHLFNRLKYTMHPSLLIADQQRRVSEVAYFSL